MTLTSTNRYGQRAYSTGLQLTIGNSAGVAAPYLYDNSSNTLGWGVTLGLLGFALCVYSALHVHFRIVNARRDRGEEDWKREGKSEEEIREMGSESPDYRYQI